jgi:hypothetical protein
VLPFAACERNTTEPVGDSELRGRAIALDVDLDSNFVRQAGSGAGEAGALLGHNEVTATMTNWTKTNLGSPSRVRVRFDLALTNNLANADLVPATFPEPPTAQVVAFPFSTEPSTWWHGKVKATSDWNGTGQPGSGSPWNFFNNDRHCYGSLPPSDCYRWEAFGAVVNAGATTPARNVGFDVDYSVRRFRVYVVVAADIRERPLPEGTGGVAGTVTSANRGPLAGVLVSGGGELAATGATGLFVLSGLTPGDVALTLSNLPSGCTAPASTVTVVAGQVTATTIAVDCPAAGAVSGQVVSNGTGLAGLEVRVVGTGFSATTNDDGGFHFDGVLAGAQSLTLVTVPAGCTDPGATSVTVPAAGVVHTVINVQCPTAGAGRLAVMSTQSGNNELWVLDLDGSNPTRLTFTAEAELFPAWSPDASQIAFVRRTGSQELVVVVNADGTNERVLTPLLPDAANPTWSPDGQRIAFTCLLPPDGFGDELCLMNADGSNLHIVRDRDGFSFPALHPDWHPNADRLAHLPGSVANPDGQFMFVGSDGLLAGDVTTGLNAAIMPAWSPDGATLAFSRIQGGDNDIYTIPANGGTPVTVASGPGMKNSPTWTRDGSSIVYESGGNLYRVSTAGGTPVQLTTGGVYFTPHVR